MQENNKHDWKPPLFLKESLLPKWPQDVFPEVFGIFVSELSRSTETPIELAALITLSAVGSASQKNYQVQIKEGYREPVNIWTLPILPPASRKSRVYNEVTSPLKEWEKEKKTLLDPIIQSATSKRKTSEVRLKELRNTASKTKDEATYSVLQQQIELLEKALPEVPVYPQLWTSDVTPEQLGNIMAANGEAMSVLSDEGGIFDILSGLYSDGKANIDLFLQAHAGSPVRVDRKSGPPILMDRPVLSMGLTVQPQVIKNICGNKTFKGRGLLGRFLYAMPKSNIGARTLEEPPMTPQAITDYRDALRAILNHAPHPEGNTMQHILYLDENAYRQWLKYSKSIEILMNDEVGILSHITDWAGKLPGAIARIAGLLHIMRYAHQNPSEHPISLEDMSAAVKIGNALKDHALVVFDLLSESGNIQIARAILEWIKKETKLVFTLRGCKRKFRRLKEKEDILPALDVLEAHEIIKELVQESKPGRKSDIYDINPLIFESDFYWNKQ